MGKAIEKIAKEMNVEVAKIIRSHEELQKLESHPDYIAIEFTSPNECLKNVETLAKKNISVICGTTGWYQDMDKMKNIISKNNIGFLYGENFGLGVHMFWKSVASTAKLLNKTKIYNVSVFEEHHIHKKDAPSGTAKKTAEILIENLDEKKSFEVKENNNYISEEKGIVPITYSRRGDVFGEHRVTFDSDMDSIEITHKSKGRDSYASGSIKCAQWLHNKKGFFNIEDYIKTI